MYNIICMQYNIYIYKSVYVRIYTKALIENWKFIYNIKNTIYIKNWTYEQYILIIYTYANNIVRDNLIESR